MVINLNNILQALEDANCLVSACTNDIQVEGAYCDSRIVEPDSLFICKGRAFKPEYLMAAINCGAKVALAPAEMELPEVGIPVIRVSNIREAQAVASKIAWGKPDEKLTIVGITGTKGKTTVATFVEHAISECLQTKCGFIGTHRVFDGKSTFEPPNTTPEPPDLYRFLHSMVKNRCTHCVMEVSSQGLKYDRVLGFDLNVAAITNIGIDHIAPVEHPTLEDYVSSKFKIAELTNNLVIAKHLPLCAEVEELCEAEMAKLKGQSVTYFDTPKPRLELQLMGETNQRNSDCALKICEVLKLDARKATEAICNTKVPGRMEVYESKDGCLVGIVDYAHTLESYELFFHDIKTQFPEHYVIAYFGVSGGKALQRYADLPQTAAKYCDYLIITSDDPGTEVPADVVERCASYVPRTVPTTIEGPSPVAKGPSPAAKGPSPAAEGPSPAAKGPSPMCAKDRPQCAPRTVPFEKIVSRDEACGRAFELAECKISEGKKVCVCALGKGNESVCVCAKGDIPIVPDSENVERHVLAH